MPPAKIITRPWFDAWIPKNWLPGWLFSPRSFVVMSKARAVQALSMEMSMLPIQALSMRTCATRLPPKSTTAMFMGCPISRAFSSAASMTRLASVNVTISLLLRTCLSGVLVLRFSSRCTMALNARTEMKSYQRIPVMALALLLQAGLTGAQSTLSFAPFDAWKAAVAAGDRAALVKLYSANLSGEAKFWAGLKSSGFEDVNPKVLEITTAPRVARLLLRIEAVKAIKASPDRENMVASMGQ